MGFRECYLESIPGQGESGNNIENYEISKGLVGRKTLRTSKVGVCADTGALL